MPNLRLSGIWAQIPWRRRKDEPEQSVSAKRRSNAPLRKEWRPFSRSGEGALPPVTEVTEEDARPKSRRMSKIWRNEDISESSTMRNLSASYRRLTRSFDPPQDQASPVIIEQAGIVSTDALPSEETLLTRLKRRSQNLSLPRPRTSSGVPRRRSFFGGTAHGDREDVPALPDMPEEQQRSRPRHVPISIDYLQFPLDTDPIANRQSIHDTGPGTAITSNDVHKPTVDQPRSRPLSFSNSFSQLRQRTSMFSSQRAIPDSVSELSSNDDNDVITALPTLDAKELRRPTSHMPQTTTQYSDSPYAPADRAVLQRVTPKIVDILAPRPMSMISASATPRIRSRPSTANTAVTSAPSFADRHKSMFTPPITTMNDEDGPKGDWARTRHSWIGVEGERGGSEQQEWDKLKQFIEAYSAGIDTSVVSIRQVDDSSDSSGSDSAATGQQKYSNAQALAALEFGLN